MHVLTTYPCNRCSCLHRLYHNYIDIIIRISLIVLFNCVAQCGSLSASQPLSQTLHVTTTLQAVQVIILLLIALQGISWWV